MFEQALVGGGKIRFGVFEIDLRSGELRKCGIRIKLQSQPFRVLALLLSHAGEVVTREELQRQIWGSETVVNFDHSLGTAVNKVREALGDSAEHPRYIETLAKRGYRFIAPVEPLESPVSVSKADRQGQSGGPAPKQDIPRQKLIRLGMLGVAGTVLLALAGTWAWKSTATVRPILLPFRQITLSGSIFPGEPGIERFPVHLTDGSRLYFSTIEDGRVILAYSAVSGDEVHPLIVPPEVRLPRLADISADGSKLLVFGHTLTELEGPIWIVPSAGGAARKVISGPGHDATWMPDRNTVLYASGSNILSTRNDGSEPRVLASVPGRAFWLRCAPDGSRVRFTVVDAATRARSLWQFTFADRKLRPLLPGWSNPASECCGNWTPDGKYFVFQSDRYPQSNIWALPEGNSRGAAAPFRLTAGPLRFVGPVPAHNGSEIFLAGAQRRSELRRYDSTSRQFLPYLRDISAAGRTELSRNGTRVAWISTRDGGLWQSKLDGSGRLQLTSRPMMVFMMRWSPDARSIAFMGKEPGKTWKIYSISAEGGRPAIVSDEDRSQADPDWSPDGRSIVFGRSSEYMAEDSTPKSIQVVDLASRRAWTLPGSEGLFCPRWSPDGAYIAALALDQHKLVLYDVAAKRWTAIATGTFNNPVWSRNGKSIYYQSYDEGNPIRRIQLDSRRIEEVAAFRHLQPGVTVEYWGITAEDAPIASFRFSTADIYSITWANR